MMKWRVVQRDDGWVVEILNAVALILNGALVKPEEWEVVGGPFSTREEAERKKTRLEREVMSEE